MVFTDVASSTKLKELVGDPKANQLIQEHFSILREVLKNFADAQEVATAGDSMLSIFPTPSAAVSFALRAQVRLAKWNLENEIRVEIRIGIHVGEVQIVNEPRFDLQGAHVDRCARIMGEARPGRIFLSSAAYESASASLKGVQIPDVQIVKWRKQGEFSLKGVADAVEIWEVFDPTLATAQRGMLNAALSRVPSLKIFAVVIVLAALAIAINAMRKSSKNPVILSLTGAMKVSLGNSYRQDGSPVRTKHEPGVSHGRSAILFGNVGQAGTNWTIQLESNEFTIGKDGKSFLANLRQIELPSPGHPAAGAKADIFDQFNAVKVIVPDELFAEPSIEESGGNITVLINGSIEKTCEIPGGKITAMQAASAISFTPKWK